MNNSNARTVWESTVAMLGRMSAPVAVPGSDKLASLIADCRARRANTPSRPIAREVNPANFTIVERVSERAILICLRDATLGHYAEQLWMKGIARRSTLCVLSGLRVRRGDIVYRPSTRGKRAVNCEEIVLAIMVDGTTANLC